MAVTAALCNSFKRALMQLGITDTYKIALYTSAATLSKATTAYTAAGEVSGSGYTAGGQALAGFSATLDGDTAIFDWADPVWPNATITARGALIYNASQYGTLAVAVLDFGADMTSTNGAFTVVLPAPTAAAGLIRIA